MTEGRVAAIPGESVDRAARSREISLPPQSLKKFLEKSIHTPPRALKLVASRSARGVWPRETTRDRDRRPRACLASTHSGRFGTPPRATKGPREELADGEAARLRWPHEKRGPGVRNRRTERREAPRLGIEARTRLTSRRTALRPPRFFEGKPCPRESGDRSSLGAEALAGTFRHARPCAGHPRLGVE